MMKLIDLKTIHHYSAILEYKGRVAHITHIYTFEMFRKQIDREENIKKLLKSK